MGMTVDCYPTGGNYRDADLTTDSKKTPEKLTVHKDFPQWTRSKDEQVEVLTAKCQTGVLGWILIDQGSYHGIPRGGRCAGWFVGAVSRDFFLEYLGKVNHHLERLRRGELKSANDDPEGHQTGFTALDAIVYDFCKGSRAHLYGSGKTVQRPHSMAANKFPFRQHRHLTRKAFSVVRGGREQHESNEVIMGRLERRGLARAFRKSSSAGPWNIDPSAFGDEELLCFFDIEPQLETKESNKKRKRE